MLTHLHVQGRRGKSPVALGLASFGSSNSSLHLSVITIILQLRKRRSPILLNHPQTIQSTSRSDFKLRNPQLCSQHQPHRLQPAQRLSQATPFVAPVSSTRMQRCATPRINQEDAKVPQRFALIEAGRSTLSKTSGRELVVLAR